MTIPCKMERDDAPDFSAAPPLPKAEEAVPLPDQGPFRATTTTTTTTTRTMPPTSGSPPDNVKKGQQDDLCCACFQCLVEVVGGTAECLVESSQS